MFIQYLQKSIYIIHFIATVLSVLNTIDKDRTIQQYKHHWLYEIICVNIKFSHQSLFKKNFLINFCLRNITDLIVNWKKYRKKNQKITSEEKIVHKKKKREREKKTNKYLYGYINKISKDKKKKRNKKPSKFIYSR